MEDWAEAIYILSLPMSDACLLHVIFQTAVEVKASSPDNEVTVRSVTVVPAEKLESWNISHTLIEPLDEKKDKFLRRVEME